MLEDLRDYGIIWQNKVRCMPSIEVKGTETLSAFFETFQSHTTCDNADLVCTSTADSQCHKHWSHYTGIYRTRNELQAVCLHRLVLPQTGGHLIFADPYSDNPLQTAVLNLFVSLKSRFPNLVVGAITRESVKKALTNGITADQVRLPPHFLKHAF